MSIQLKFDLANPPANVVVIPNVGALSFFSGLAFPPSNTTLVGNGDGDNFAGEVYDTEVIVQTGLSKVTWATPNVSFGGISNAGPAINAAWRIIQQPTVQLNRPGNGQVIIQTQVSVHDIDGYIESLSVGLTAYGNPKKD